jgi:hypothetical protein
MLAFLKSSSSSSIILCISLALFSLKLLFRALKRSSWVKVTLVTLVLVENSIVVVDESNSFPDLLPLSFFSFKTFALFTLVVIAFPLVFLGQFLD